MNMLSRLLRYTTLSTPPGDNDANFVPTSVSSLRSLVLCVVRDTHTQISVSLVANQQPGLEEERAEAIGRGLADNTHLRELLIERWDMSGDVASMLGRGLAVNRTLRRLSLQSCRVDNTIVWGLFMTPASDALSASSSTPESTPTVLRSCTSLRTLNLTRCPLDVCTIDAIADVLTTDTSLEALIMEHCGIANEGIEKLAHGIRAHHCLRTLSLCSNAFDNSGIVHLMAALQNSESNLLCLDMGTNGLSDEACVAIRGALLSPDVKLEYLGLSCNNIGTEGAECLAEGLLTNRRLRVLDLYGNCVGSDGVCSVFDALRKNGSIRHIDLGGSIPGDVGAVALGDMLCVNQTLDVVRLSSVRMTQVGADAIGRGLGKNKSVRTLVLSGSHLSSTGGMAMGRALTTNTSLQRLDLSDCSLGKQGVIAVAFGLSSNRTLRHLNLQRARAGPDGISALGRVLATQATLVELHLSNNTIGKGIESLCNALIHNPTLRVLKLSNCDLGFHSVQHLSTMVHLNSSLEHLTLYNNNLTVMGVLQLFKALGSNSSLVMLGVDVSLVECSRQFVHALSLNTSLQQLDIPARGAEALTEILERNKAIFRARFWHITQILLINDAKRYVSTDPDIDHPQLSVRRDHSPPSPIRGAVGVRFFTTHPMYSLDVARLILTFIYPRFVFNGN